jgi:hypothetical protein
VYHNSIWRRSAMIHGVLLGPQRVATTVGETFEALCPEGRVAAVTAGWQEREAEDMELQRVLGHRTSNLNLHARAEAVFRDDGELFMAHRTKQDRLRRLQELYRLRLDAALTAAKQLQRTQAPPELLEPELEGAIEAVRLLDQQHLARVEEIQAAFEAQVGLSDRKAVRWHTTEIRAILAESAAVAIAGGHVASLVNRMRLFGLGALIRHLPVVAWSAGAMAVTSRVVLFHDTPPQGAGNAEVMGAGLGLFPGVVALPHASRRLALSDGMRVAIFARRFAPSACLALDERAAARYEAERWTANAHTRRLLPDGVVEPMETPWP